MPTKHPSVRSIEERDLLIQKYYRLPQHIVNQLWRVPSVQRLGHDDAIQIGFLHLTRAAELWEEDRGVLFKTYAYRAIKSGVLESSRRRQFMPLPQSEFPLEMEDSWNKRMEVVQEIRWDGVLSSVDLLPTRLREVIIKTCLEGRPYQEVGKGLKVSKERIRQLRQKALKWLKSYLEGESPQKLEDCAHSKQEATDSLL